MFDRITIPNVSASRQVRIAFSVLKPQGWVDHRDEGWIAFGAPYRRDAGFALLMQNEDDAPQASENGELAGFLEREMPGFSELEVAPLDDDDMCPYDLSYLRGKVEGVNGRIAILGTLVTVEDVVFALVGFAQDERFHEFRAMFRSIVASFQPMATSLR